MRHVPLENMSCATFAGLVNSRFDVAGTGVSPVQVALLEVVPYLSSEGNVSPDSFSLIFAGPLDQFLPQRTYALRHEQLGSFDLFLVPIAKAQDGYRYQAVFNRTSPPKSARSA